MQRPRDCNMLGGMRRREDFLCRKERVEQQRAREREQMERMEKKEHVNERSNGEPYYVQCDNNVFIRIDPPKGTSSMSSTEVSRLSSSIMLMLCSLSSSLRL